MAPRVSPARSNSSTAWRSSMLSILRGPPVVGTGPYLEAGTYLRMPGGRTEFREKSGQNLENQQSPGWSQGEGDATHGEGSREASIKGFGNGHLAQRHKHLLQVDRSTGASPASVVRRELPSAAGASVP